MVWRKWNQSVYIRQWKTTVNEKGVITSIIYYKIVSTYEFSLQTAVIASTLDESTKAMEHSGLNDFCQKCFDVECRGVSSNLFPLPSFIVNSIHKANDCSGRCCLLRLANDIVILV
ncbi:hypothetical protein ANCDUO_20985 [Ancylostoma duodenale]|uniref:Uncharacterized protein n=1 Tax=Ancylostoma duodenale TaxID=51022 RepID=A0A0C2CGP3_9BILA|nr:hypothetical protein ANCDUO_20985 [Ancylostoma duodenale]